MSAREGSGILRLSHADVRVPDLYHHLLLHDHHWEVERRGPARAEYWLIPPPNAPDAEPRPLQSKSRALSDLLVG